MQKHLYWIRLLFAFFVLGSTVLAFTARFYPVPFLDAQIGALIVRLFSDFSIVAIFFFLALLLLTLLFGRIYCGALCPLGILQELFMFCIPRRQKFQEKTFYKYFLMVLVFGFLAGGSVFLLRLLEPYTIFASAMTLSKVGIVILTLIFLLTIIKGRFFCTHLCPVGALLGIISKFSLFQVYIDTSKCKACSLCAMKCPTGCIDIKTGKVNNENCVRCFKCLNACRQNSLHYGRKPKEKIHFSFSRRHLIKGLSLVALFGLAFKGGLSNRRGTKTKDVIVPAGAGSPERLKNTCLNCNLCVQNCPVHIIKKRTESFGAVHLDYSENFCQFHCHRCSAVCPAGALKRLTLSQKQNTQIGLAQVNPEVCVQCGLCAQACPKKAIYFEEGHFPMIDFNRCIGCGACQHTCPVQAITVLPVEEQRTLTKGE